MSEEDIIKEDVKEEPNTIQIAGRTLTLGLSIRHCIEKGIKPSALKKEFGNPVFNSWEYLLDICNLGIIEGEPFTTDDMALDVMSAFGMVFVGNDPNIKSFLAMSSEDSNGKQPSS